MRGGGLWSYISCCSRPIAIALQMTALAAVSSSATAQSPDIGFHDLEWYVHDSLLANNPLSFYQNLIGHATEDAGVILMGDSGPVDSPCCTDFSVVSVGTFSDQGGNTWASIDSIAEFNNLDLVDATGHRAFVVGGITVCGNTSGNPIGCASTPECGSAPNDLTIVIDIAADSDFGLFANTLAHERGHNACLQHVSGNSCRLMGPSSGGDCISASECDQFRAERTSTGGTCGCHMASAEIANDGEACSQTGVTGICSGGVCGEIGSDASTTLVASAGTAAIVNDTPNDPLMMSGIPGGWTDQGEFSSGYTPQGLAYAADRGTTFAVSPTAGDDVLLQIDPTDGSATLLGSISGVSGLRGLAFDPGPTVSDLDDRLFAIDSDTFAHLYEIDPDDASSALLGRLDTGSGFNGLAYDSVNERLYASSPLPGGIYLIDVSRCLTQCPTTVVNADGPVRFEPGLAYSAASNSIHVIGRQVSRTLYNTLDADALASGTISSSYTRGLDSFTIGGLAATPVPEPGFGVSELAAGLCLWSLWGLRRR